MKRNDSSKEKVGFFFPPTVIVENNAHSRLRPGTTDTDSHWNLGCQREQMEIQMYVIRKKTKKKHLHLFNTLCPKNCDNNLYFFSHHFCWTPGFLTLLYCTSEKSRPIPLNWLMKWHEINISKVCLQNEVEMVTEKCTRYNKSTSEVTKLTLKFIWTNPTPYAVNRE